MTTRLLDKLDIQRRPEEASALEQNETSDLEDLMTNLVRMRERMSVSNLLIADDADIWEELDHDDMVSNTATEITEGQCDSTDEVDSVEPVLSSTEKINSIVRVMRVNELQETIDVDLQRTLSALLRKVRQESTAGLRQARIDAFFSK